MRNGRSGGRRQQPRRVRSSQSITRSEESARRNENKRQKHHKDPCHPPLPRDLASSHALRQARGHRLTACVDVVQPTQPPVPSLWPLTKTRPQNKEASLHPAGTCANEAASAPDSQGETVQPIWRWMFCAIQTTCIRARLFARRFHPHTKAHKAAETRRVKEMRLSLCRSVIRCVSLSLQERNRNKSPRSAFTKREQRHLPLQSDWTRQFYFIFLFAP